MPSFYTLPTALGEAKIANAIALGTQVNISELAVGDGGGSLPTPDSDRTALVNELRRAPINRIEVDDENPNWIVVEQILPPDVGGWTVRELGLLDDDGNLIAYGNYPETYKPVLSEGSGRTQTIRFVMQVSDTAAVTLKVDPSVVLATRQYVDDADQAHAESRDHPAATETAQGMVEMASSGEANDTQELSRAMSPRRVHEVAWSFGMGVSEDWQLPALSNADTAFKTGIYRLAPGAVGAPVQQTSCSMIVARPGINGWVQQIAMPAHQPRMYQRGYDGTSWTAWVEIYSSDKKGAGSNIDADQLDGEEGEFYRNASNLNAGKVPVARLPAASTTAIGAVEKATEAEAIAGEAGKFADSAGVRAAIDAGMAFQNIVAFKAAGVTTWSVPEDLKQGRRKAYVTVIGGGGGAGRVVPYAGAGGGGGGVAEGLVDLSGVDSVTVTVGAAGLGKVGINGTGGMGGTSSFGSYMSGGGGGGGTGNGAVPADGGTGYGGDINYSLGPSSGPTVTTPSGESTSGGSGGGPGRRGTTLLEKQPPPSSPGGGGGGSGDDGGDGSAGIVIIRF